MSRDLAHVHRLACNQAARFLFKNSGNTLLTCLLLGVSLTVPAILAVLILSTGQLVEGLDRERTLTIFLNPSLDEKSAEATALELQLNPEVEGVRYIPPQQALKEFEQTLGLSLSGEAVTKTSPLPPTAILNLNQETDLAGLIDRLKRVEGIQEVVFDQIWVTRVEAVLTAADRLFYTLSALLTIGVLLVISNMLTFTLQTHSSEFRLLTLVGATQNYIARPFLYTGLGYGPGGALVATITPSAVPVWLSDPLKQAVHNLWHSA